MPLDLLVNDEVAVDVSIVVVNWNVRELLVLCLQSLLPSASLVGGQSARGASNRSEGGHAPLKASVVDSASDDDSVSVVRERFPGVKVNASGANLGYTGGNNLGICRRQGRFVLLLNPDTEIVGSARHTG